MYLFVPLSQLVRLTTSAPSCATHRCINDHAQLGNVKHTGDVMCKVVCLVPLQCKIKTVLNNCFAHYMLSAVQSPCTACHFAAVMCPAAERTLKPLICLVCHPCCSAKWKVWCDSSTGGGNATPDRSAVVIILKTGKTVGQRWDIYLCFY